MSKPFHIGAMLPEGWRAAVYEPFREGVEISHIVTGEPGVALLRYAPGAGVPAHRHPGLEMILVLDGVQSDERGDYPAGTLMLNPAGSSHRVWSDPGCVVLIHWAKAVEFLGPEG